MLGIAGVCASSGTYKWSRKRHSLSSLRKVGQASHHTGDGADLTAHSRWVYSVSYIEALLNDKLDP